MSLPYTLKLLSEHRISVPQAVEEIGHPDVCELVYAGNVTAREGVDMALREEDCSLAWLIN